MLEFGDVVTVDFSGATGVKRRPAIVVSTNVYHSEPPDVILGVLTTNLVAAKAGSDYKLQDWRAAGLHQPSAFRCYLGTMLQSDVRRIGHLSDRDKQGVETCLDTSLGS